MSNKENKNDEKFSFETMMSEEYEKYRCANCGVINESKNGMPKHCIKCDNTKFYKL